MPKTPRMPLGLKGLNTDIPSHSLPLDFFNAGNNMRSFNGALNGVNSFSENTGITFHTSTSENPSVIGVYDAAQFTPAGSSYYNIIALVQHNDGSFKFKAYSSDSGTATVQVAVSDYTMTLNAAKSLIKNETLTQATSNATAKVKYGTSNSTTVRLYDITGTWTIGSQNITGSVTGALSTHPTQIEDHVNSVTVTSGTFDHDSTSNTQTVTIGYDPEFGSDMFVFNETLVINTVKSKPLYLAAQGSKISVVDNWPADVDVGLVTFDNSEYDDDALAVHASGASISISPGSTINIGSAPFNTGGLTVPPSGGSSPTSITNSVPLHVLWRNTHNVDIDLGFFQVIGTSDGSTALTSTAVHFPTRGSLSVTPEKFKTITGFKFSNNSNMDSAGSNLEIDYFKVGLGYLTPKKEKLFTPKIAQFGGRLVALGLFGEGSAHWVGSFDTTSTPASGVNNDFGEAPNNTFITADDGIYNERASVIFSSPITELGSLAGIEWTVASTNSTVDDIITESPGAVVDGGQLGDNFIVYKSDCVLSYREITSSPYILGRVIQTDDGILSSRCFADIGNNSHIVFGNHGIYIHNGENQKQNVSKNKVQDALYAEINMSKKGQCFVFRHEQDKETWFCIPTTNHTGKGCDKAYVYAEETDSWYTRELATSSNQHSTSHIFSTELDGTVKNFACKTVTNTSQNTTLNAHLLHELSTTAFVSGGTAEFLNNPLETSAITKTVTTAYPMCNGAVKVGLTSTDNIGDSASVTTKDFNPANDHKLSFRETGRYFDMKVEMNSTTNPEVTAMEFDVNPRGKR